MEDRWGKLALEAHVGGALNFSEFRRYDRYWMLKEQVVFDALEDRLAIEMNKLVHTWNSGAARSNIWDERGDDFEFHRKEADKAYKAVGRLALPWYNAWAPEKSLVEVWKDFKEHEKDPAFQARRKVIKSHLQSIDDKAKFERRSMARVAERQKEHAKALDKRKRRGPNGRLHKPQAR